MSLEKALLICNQIGKTVECQYRPKDYKLEKTVKWQPATIVGANMQRPRYQGGEPMKLRLDLTFDTYEAKQDVRTKTRDLWDMIKPIRRDGRTNRGEPPHVEFRWGKFWSFKGVITSISQEFTMFLSDGTPARSKLVVEILQAVEFEKHPAQNPTSGGRESYGVHTVLEGETIDLIAYQEYGDPNAWRHLASANGLDDPHRLRPGQRLLLAPLNE